MNATSSTTATEAPHHAVLAGSSATATASSTTGSRSAAGPHDHSGMPKSTSASREPFWSESLAAPATKKTVARTSRHASSSALIPSSPDDQLVVSYKRLTG